MRMIPSAGYIYLASPYSHPNAFVREMRYLLTMEELALQLKSGLHVYSPIVHCHELAKVMDLPRNAEFWKKYNFCMLGCAEHVSVLMLDGWKTSLGVTDEIIEAKRVNIPVAYLEPRKLP